MTPDASRGLRRRCVAFTAFTTVLTVVVSALGLMAWPHGVWILDGDLAMTSVPGRAAEWGMLIAGLALWLRRTPPDETAPRDIFYYLAQVMGAAIFLIGLVALTAPGVGAVVGFTREAPMGANSALVFCLLGMSFLTLDVTTRSGRRPAEIGAVLVALIAMAALFGYTYRVSELYTVHHSYPMVPRTAILGFLLAVAVLCARPAAGFMALATSISFGGTLLRRLLPASMVMLFALGWLRLEGERRGLYSMALGVALFTLANIAIFTLLVWWNARTMHRLEQERDTSEEKRNKAVALNQLIMENSLDVLSATDDAGRFLKVSSAATAQWGYTPAELIGRRYADLLHPEDRDRTAQVAVDIMSGRPASGFTNRFIRKDGSVVPIDWSAAWSRSDNLMFSVARDATERLQVAEALRQSADELAYTNRELESFTYSVSHDLRAPLRHIDGYARMLAEDGGDRLDGELRRYLDEIGASARRMGRLIDDLLAFSRLSRQPLTRLTVDMKALVDSALSEAASDGPLAATVAVGSLPAVQADPALLRQVWTNLLANAIKYSGKRGTEALVEVTGESDGTRVRYQVRDNGVGFDMRYVDKLFQVFQRLHLQDEFEGTGVGLAIVQRIISRHGGRVWAEGELGKGATFTFELPIAGEQPEGNMA
jgi:PAS domain S-box-containing protein